MTPNQKAQKRNNKFFSGKTKRGAKWLRTKCANRLRHLRSIGK